MNPLTFRLELDVWQSAELLEAVELTVKHQLPAMVVHPQLVQEVRLLRAKRQGRFAVLLAVDHPKGDNYGPAKFRGLSNDCFSADGYEVTLTPGRSMVDVRGECKAVNELVRGHISPVAQVRFVVGSVAQTREGRAAAYEAMLDVPMPHMVRNDWTTRASSAKAGPDQLAAWLEEIAGKFSAPFKVCGNLTLDGVRKLDAGPVRPARYGLNLQQAKAIINALQS